ncbi:MAG: hypothetical protein AB1420_01755 [Bacillota bacterium]
MGFYFWLALFLVLCLIIFIFYVRNCYSQEYSCAVLLITHNCADICEGVVKEAVKQVASIEDCAFLIIDRNSTDETFEILKRLSLKYKFELLKGPEDEFSAMMHAKNIFGNNCVLLLIDEKTSFSKAKIRLAAIRHSFTYSTLFH